jgi:hypothetical protein
MLIRLEVPPYLLPSTYELQGINVRVLDPVIHSIVLVVGAGYRRYRRYTVPCIHGQPGRRLRPRKAAAVAAGLIV